MSSTWDSSKSFVRIEGMSSSMSMVGACSIIDNLFVTWDIFLSLVALLCFPPYGLPIVILRGLLYGVPIWTKLVAMSLSFSYFLVDTYFSSSFMFVCYPQFWSSWWCYDDGKSSSSLRTLSWEKLHLSASRNHAFKGCSQATYIFACENAWFSQAALSWSANLSHCN